MDVKPWDFRLFGATWRGVVVSITGGAAAGAGAKAGAKAGVGGGGGGAASTGLVIKYVATELRGSTGGGERGGWSMI
jgi:hypothetical protein